ncbi:MAG: hypothetical protein JXR67_11005 [Bacteroidales bacterium]|nr:hypothetical protein [Bacteroidales bacterium]
MKNYQEEQTLEEIRAAGIAHDLNNVLTVISGYAEMLRDDLACNELFKENAERILSAIDRAKSLTGKLLESGNSPSENKTIVNLNDVVAETLDFFRPSLPSEISLITGFHTEAIPVSADSSELLRVFLNIIRNAVQSMEGKGGTLSVHSSVREDEEKHTGEDSQAGKAGIVTITDTGCGMDSLTLERIFEPYFTLRSYGSGTGIGLYVSREIIRGLGGTISVSSRENEGTVFTVCLPLFNRG